MKDQSIGHEGGLGRYHGIRSFDFQIFRFFIAKNSIWTPVIFPFFEKAGGIGDGPGRELGYKQTKFAEV